MNPHSLSHPDSQQQQAAVGTVARSRRPTGVNRVATRFGPGCKSVNVWSRAALEELGLDVYTSRRYHAIVRRAAADGMNDAQPFKAVHARVDPTPPDGRVLPYPKKAADTLLDAASEEEVAMLTLGLLTSEVTA
jgi:hypothetical protein